MGNAVADLRYAWRQLRRTPSFTGIGVLTLALGIGANTTFFGLIDAAIWRPMRGVDVSDTYFVHVERPRRPPAPGERFDRPQRALTMAQLEYLKSVPELGVVAVSGASTRHMMAQTPFDAARLMVAVTHGDFAGVMQMRPLVGRLAGLEDNGSQAGPNIVISERIWRAWFRADPAAVGRDTIRIRRQTFTVAGVVPQAQSHFGDAWIAAESWRAVEPDVSAIPVSGQIRFRDGSQPERLRPMIDHALGAGPTPPTQEFKARLFVFRNALSDASVVRMTWLVMGLSAVVLLAACANLANMLYARATQRTGEIAVRVSLGASTRRVFRLLMIDASLIAGAASAVGAVFAWAGLRYVTVALPGATLDRFTGLPIDISPDWRVFAYAVAAGSFAAVMVGGFTAWRGSRTPPLRMLGGSGIGESTKAGGRWLRTGLVAVQVSAAVVLLLGTGLYLIRGFEKPSAAVTFETNRLATAQLEFDERFNSTQVPDVLQQIVTSVERLEGIEAGAITDGMFGGSYSRPRPLMNLVAEDEFLPGTVSRSRIATGQQAAVSSRFLDVLGLELLSGRNLQPTDVAGAPEVVLLSRSAARKLWQDADPLGRRVKLAGDRRWFTVVGTFEDPTRSGTGDSSDCAGCVALSAWAQYTGREWLVVLRSTAPGVAVQQVRPAVDAINQDVPVFNATIADRSIFNDTNSSTAFRGLVGSLGFLALLIAALGVYAVMSYTVSRRTREFGIRLALGATPTQILRAVIDDAVHLVLVGLLPGVLLASWATRALEWQIMKLMPNDISTWAIVPILILVIGVVAAWIPARRASRVNPNVALRDL